MTVSTQPDHQLKSARVWRLNIARRSIVWIAALSFGITALVYYSIPAQVWKAQKVTG